MNLFDTTTFGIEIKEENRRDGEVVGLITLDPRQDDRTAKHGIGLIAAGRQEDCEVKNDIRMVRMQSVWEQNHH